MSVVNIAELLSNVLTSTLKAEQQGFEKYLSILKELESLGSVAFTYYNEEGLEQTLEVPILTLVPLTMLHIEEAVFDFSLKVSEKDNASLESKDVPSISQGDTSAVSGTSVSQRLQNIQNQARNIAQSRADAAGTGKTSDGSNQVMRPTLSSMSRNNTSNPSTSQALRSTKLMSTVDRRIAKISRKTASDSVEAALDVVAANQLVNRTSDLSVQVTSDKEDATNLTVRVEMGQTDLTAGLIAMLQRKNNSINE